MKESSTYQAILEEGRTKGMAQGIAQGLAVGAVAEAKKVLRLQGDEAFGPPDPAHCVILSEVPNRRRP